MIQRPMTQTELRQRINTYSLAVEPLVKIAVRIRLSQPHMAYRIKSNGGLEPIEEYCGWSEEAKSLYATVLKELEYLKELYFGELTKQRRGTDVIDGVGSPEWKAG